MQKFISFVLNYPILFVLLVGMVLYFPVGISQQSETNVKAIATTIGVDKEEDLYVVSAIIISPKENTSFLENDTMLVSKGKTISKAILEMSLHVGKNVVLAHTDLIIFGESLASENILNVLDYFTRKTDLSNDTFISVVEGSAQRLVENAKELSKNLGLTLQEIIQFNESFNYSAKATVESFYNGYYSPGRSSMITELKLSNELYEGIDSSGGQSQTSGDSGNASISGSGSSTSSQQSNSNQGSGSQTGQNQKVISNHGGARIYKDGIEVGVLTPEQVNGINYMEKTSHKGSLFIENVNEKDFEDASMVFLINDKNINLRMVIENEIPVLAIRLNLVLLLQELESKNNTSGIFDTKRGYITPYVFSLIENKVKRDIASAMKMLKEKKADVLNFAVLFKNKDAKQYNSIVQKYGEDGFFDKIMVQVYLSVEEKL